MPPPNYPLPAPGATDPKLSISDFFELDWVNAPGARPEILFLRRSKGTATANGKPTENGFANGHAKPTKNTSESHVAFPGGRMEEGDEGGLYTGKVVFDLIGR